MPDSTQTFSKYKALVFDCYGTLIDWESGIHNCLKPLFEANGKPSEKRAIIDAFIAVEVELQTRYPSMLYSDLLAKLYTTLEARLQGKEAPPDSEALHDKSASDPPHSPSPAAEAFAQSVEGWPPFPDTIAALTALSKHFKLVILSNIDRATIAKTRRAMEGPGAFAFDAVYTAEDAGAYKPAPEMLDYALGHLESEFGIGREEVIMTAQSVFHDIVPAKGRGMATAWIDRQDACMRPPGPAKGDEAMWIFQTLGEMAEAVEKSG